MKPLPFFTSHTPLALALEQAGATMVALWNVYTPEKIAALNCATMTEAHARGLHGSVTYFFEKTEQLETLLAAWNDQQEKMKAGQLVTLARPEPEDVVRIIASAFAARKEFQDLWKTAVPMLQVPRPGDIRTTQTNEDGSKVITHPGFRLISANASKETREHLKL